MVRVSGSQAWKPITILQVDADATLNDPPFRPNLEERYWIEVVRRGQVVGVVDVRVEDDDSAQAVGEDLATTFADVALSAYRSVPDDLLAKATVVVPTICQNPPELVRTVNSLLAVDYPNFEIIVVDNRVGVDLEELPKFQNDPRVHIASEPQRGASAARNKGAALATGDFVAFTDDDAVVDCNWLRVMGARFASSVDVHVVTGVVLPMELDTIPQLWFEEFYGGFSPSFRGEILSIARIGGTDKLFPYAPGRFGAGCNMAFRRSALERLGGFDVSLGPGTPAKGGEDLDLFVQLLLSGGSLAFEPACLVRHSHRRTEREFMNQVSDYGTGLTAMYTAMIVRDPRNLLAMIRRIPAGLRLLTRPRGQRSPSVAPSYPRRTLVHQVLGMAYGPLAYARSVARTRWFAR